MRAGRLGVARPAVRPSNAVILFWVGPYRMGIEAAALKEIRNNDQATPAGSGCEAVLAAHELLGVTAGSERRMLILRPGRVAVRVDRVERMIETSALRLLPLAFRGAERSWYSGLVLIGETVCPILNPETLAREAKLLGQDARKETSVLPAAGREAAAL